MTRQSDLALSYNVRCMKNRRPIDSSLLNRPSIKPREMSSDGSDESDHEVATRAQKSVRGVPEQLQVDAAARADAAPDVEKPKPAPNNGDSAASAKALAAPDPALRLVCVRPAIDRCTFSLLLRLAHSCTNMSMYSTARANRRAARNCWHECAAPRLPRGVVEHPRELFVCRRLPSTFV